MRMLTTERLRPIARLSAPKRRNSPRPYIQGAQDEVDSNSFSTYANLHRIRFR